MPLMDVLGQFIQGASEARLVTELQCHWNTFLGHFDICGYRVIPASLGLLKRVYDEIAFPSKPKLSWLQYHHKTTAPLNTCLDIAHKVPPGWREFYTEHELHRYDPVLTKEIVDRGPFTREEADLEYNTEESQKLHSFTREWGGWVSNLAMSFWLKPDVLVAASLYLPYKGDRLNSLTRFTLQGGAYIFCTRYSDLTQPPASAPAPEAILNPRELDVLHWAALGYSKHEIASFLDVSTSCIKRHCESLFIKLEVSNMASAVARAMAYGLLCL